MLSFTGRATCVWRTQEPFRRQLIGLDAEMGFGASTFGRRVKVPFKEDCLRQEVLWMDKFLHHLRNPEMITCCTYQPIMVSHGFQVQGFVHPYHPEDGFVAR